MEGPVAMDVGHELLPWALDRNAGEGCGLVKGQGQESVAWPLPRVLLQPACQYRPSGGPFLNAVNDWHGWECREGEVPSGLLQGRLAVVLSERVQCVDARGAIGYNSWVRWHLPLCRIAYRDGADGAGRDG